MYVCQEKEKKKGKKKCMHARESLGMKEFKSTHTHMRGKARSAKKKQKGSPRHLMSVSGRKGYVTAHFYLIFERFFLSLGKERKKSQISKWMTKAAPPPPPDLLRINSTYHTEMFIRRWQGGLWGTGRLHNIVTILKTPWGGVLGGLGRLGRWGK